MTTLAANPRRLGGAIGGVAVLHTWGQALMHHPHVHSPNYSGFGCARIVADRPGKVYLPAPYANPEKPPQDSGNFKHKGPVGMGSYPGL